jgi:predicted DNA-binding transcriptional regulator AlpA
MPASGDDLVPLKRMLEALSVSRATFWRLSRSGAASFPAPVQRGGRLYWRPADIEAIRAALAEFRGRTEFERSRAGARAEQRCGSLLAARRARARARRVRVATPVGAQGDLFGR